jgi:beta-lactamase regulating signal transducer with metallopeptidase domain
MASYLLMNGLQLLLDSAVKSVAVMLAAWMLVTALRRASAATRHWVWSVALAGLLVLPVLSLALPSWRIELLPSLANNANDSLAKSEGETESTVSTLAATSDSGTQVSTNGSSQASKLELDPTPKSSAGSPLVRRMDDVWPAPIPAMLRGFEMLRAVNWTAAALMFWAVGMLLVIARLVTGTFRIWRLAKSASLVSQNSWIALAQALAIRLRLRSGVELRQSEQVALPMTWGAWRSVVMLPADADEWPQECRSIVLLHELAHVKRRDCLTQNLAQLACALYWFNPLVWLAVRQLHVEREVACDDQVLEVGTKASEYASHLVEIARSFSATDELSPVAVGMACSQLESRVRSILDPDVRRRGLNRLSAGVIAFGAVCLILSLAVVQPWSKTAASSYERTIVKAQVTEAQDELQISPAASDTVAQTPETKPSETSEAAGATNQESREQETAQAAAEDDEQDNSQTKARSSELTADQIIEMRTAGVTPEFIAAMRQQGFDNLTVRELTQLSIHGINADYIKQARSWGGDKVTVKEIIQLKISGVTPEYIAAMKQAGYDGMTARQLSELRIHGVTPEFVATMRRLGYDNLTANQISSLKIHGIDEAFVKEMQSWTGGKPSVNELTQIKIHGVTPEFARQMKALGYDNLSINKLTELKIHGVDEAFIKEMQNWTGGKPTVNELTQIKIHGVTPEFARRMRAMGFDNLSINKLTELRIHGIDEKYIKEMRDLGFDNLTVNQLIQMRVHGVDADYVKKMRAAGLKNVSANQMIEMKITGIDSILLKEKVKDKR